MSYLKEIAIGLLLTMAIVFGTAAIMADAENKKLRAGLASVEQQLTIVEGHFDQCNTALTIALDKLKSCQSMLDLFDVPMKAPDCHIRIFDKE